MDLMHPYSKYIVYVYLNSIELYHSFIIPYTNIGNHRNKISSIITVIMCQFDTSIKQQ